MAKYQSKEKNPNDRAPSISVMVGNDRIMEKLLDPELGLKNLIEETFGVTLSSDRSVPRNEKPRDGNGKREIVAGTPINRLHIAGKTKDERRAVSTVVKGCVDRIKDLEKDALEAVLKHPERHAQRLVRMFDTKEASEFAGFVSSTMNMLDNTGGKRIRDGASPEATSAAAMSTVRSALKRSKNALSGSKPVHVTKELLATIYALFPDINTLAEPYKGKCEQAKNAIDQRILALHDMVDGYNRQQMESHNSAKARFSSEERDEVARRITIAVATKKLKLESSQASLIEHRALKNMNEATIDETFLGTIAVFQKARAPQKPLVAAPTIINERFREHRLYQDRFTPASTSQVQQIATMRNNALSIVVGDAGTGKTITAIAYAMDRLVNDRKKIVIVRPMTELGDGDEMGYLPGGEKEKIGPGFRPIINNLYQLNPNINEIKRLLGLNKPKGEGSALMDMLLPTEDIQLLPLSSIRGMTLNNVTLIAEEAQNLTLMQAEALITRAGKGTKVILAGDKIQTDLELTDRRGEWLSPRHMPALPVLLQMAKQNSWMGVTIHPPEAVQRSEMVQQAVGVFGEIRENMDTLYPQLFDGYEHRTLKPRPHLGRTGS